MILGYLTIDTVWGLKGQRSRSQGHEVQKHIEGDLVAGVSYTLSIDYCNNLYCTILYSFEFLKRSGFLVCLCG